MKEWIAILIALLLAACTTSTTTPVASNHAALEQLLQADRDFAAAAQTRRVEAWVDYFAENSAKPDGPASVVVGKEGVRKQMTPLYEDATLDFKWWPVRADISRGGNLGTTWGHYRLARTVEGELRVSEGDYISVWQKQKDGSWKVLYDAGEPLAAAGQRN